LEVAMRMLLKAQLDVEAANRATKDGSLAGALTGVMEQIQPEAAYFLTEHGKRTALIIFDLKDPSQIPVVAEPFFHNVNATVELTPG
jgi:hypothetical protein